LNFLLIFSKSRLCASFVFRMAVIIFYYHNLVLAVEFNISHYNKDSWYRWI